MLKANLFEIPLEESSLQESALTTDLPSAKINLDITFNDYNISSYGAPKIGAISQHSFIAMWEERQLNAELLTTKYIPIIPSHLRIAYSWAYLWRIITKEDLSFVTFECCVNPKQSIIDEDIETGECLFSKCFSFGNESIYIGTEDTESLFQRADSNNGFPARYIKERNTAYNNLLESSKLGIKINLPSLKAREFVQLQFVVAGGADPLANWLAVDANPKDILLQAACK